MIEAPVLPAETAPTEPTTEIKPSEYLRFGAMAYPQGFGTLVGIKVSKSPPRVEVTEACALGAMQLAAGAGLRVDSSGPLPVVEQYSSAESERITGRLHRKVEVPCSCSFPTMADTSAFSVIMHLNDVDRWDRNRIADWLESIGY